MKSGATTLFTRSALLLCALILPSTASFGQSVSGFILGKIQNFRQTSSVAPIADSAQPYQFGALITPGTATINSATLTFSGTASPRAFTDEGGGVFSILDTFTTQGQLDAAYGSGNYTVNIDSSDGMLSSTIFLFPFSYPVTARLSVPAADWQNNVLVIDPSVDYTLTWEPFSNAQAVDVIQFAIRNSIVIPAPFPATQTSFTVPAGSLLPDTDYPCDLAFARVAGVTTGGTDIGPGYATLAKDTGFMIHTTAGSTTPTPTATATPTATPIITPTPTATAAITPTATPDATPTATPGTTPTPAPTQTPTSTPTSTPTATPAVTPTPTSTPATAQALNISTRMRVDTGNNVLIGGFIVTGTAFKNVAVRGIGPSLGAFGVPDALADPTLELRGSKGGLIRANDDWQDDPAGASMLSMLGLAPTDPKESGIVATLQPGPYTAVLAGKDNGTGVGLMEIYDTNPASASQLGNISTRGFVLTGNNVMIGGFILGGTNSTHVVVRGIGPSLADFGLDPVLADPILEGYDSNGTNVVINDDWQDDPVSAAHLTSLGLAPSNPKESGIYTSLPPGAFTVILAGKDGGAGIGLVEIYNVH